MRGILLSLFVIAFIGVLTPVNYILPIVIMLFLVISLMIIKFPDNYGYFVLIISSISLQYIIHVSLGPLDMASIYKLLLLLMIVMAIFRLGYNISFVYLPIIFFIILLNSIIFSKLPINLSYIDIMKAFIGLVTPWGLLLIRWPRYTWKTIINLICLLPIISASVGGVLTLLGVYQFYSYEYTGVMRFQGSNIPAHLAMLAYIAFVVALIEGKRSHKRYYILALTNFLILLLTGTRGPLIATILPISVYFLDNIKAFLSGKIKYLMSLMIFLGVLITMFILEKDKLLARSKSDGGTVLNLSGRDEAWQFFLDKAHDSSLFGKGIGSILLANDGSIFGGFVVPHNEYIRFYYETGYVGSILLLGTFIFTFWLIYRELDKKIRLYYISFVIGTLIYSFSDNTFSTVQYTVPFCWYLSVMYSASIKRPISN
ncbi:hypothetical protein ABH62_05660 [Bacillus cereus]|uniref:O-antigen ligase-related domain-containing protein n=2 Tax=Bacillaceae TaxID=186817 RepID=A0A9X5VBJ0_BACCE|nr:hypothetical protein ABH62_05660 [Bacillus cereus]OJS95521.1 hypothetical protein BKK64_13210 [Bacillus cereus]